MVGVGHKLLEELFHLPSNLSPELALAIEEFCEKKKTREKKIIKLTKLSKLGGVKGNTAKHELHAMEAADMTDMNRIEITLNAAKRKAKKNR